MSRFQDVLLHERMAATEVRIAHLDRRLSRIEAPPTPSRLSPETLKLLLSCVLPLLPFLVWWLTGSLEAAKATHGMLPR